MSPEEILRLKQPCKNRGLEFVDNKDGVLWINEKPFHCNRDAEDYLVTFERKD